MPRPTLLLAILCCLGFSLSVLLDGVAVADSAPDDAAAQMREDLVYLRDTWGSKDRSFSEQAKASFVAEIDELSANLDGLTAERFSLEVARLVAIGGNGHSAVSLPKMPSLPIHLWPFDDGLFIVSAQPDHADLVGAQVLRIGDTPAKEALRRVSTFIPGNEPHQRIEAPRLLENPLALERAHVIRHASKVKLTVIDSRHRQRQVSLTTDLRVEPPGSDTWTVLVPTDATAPNRWPHVLDTRAPRPKAFASVDDLSYEWLSTAPRVLYLRLNQIGSDDDVRLDLKLLEMTVKELVDQPARAVIVDLRYNMGGNFFYTIVFSQLLSELLDSNGKVLVLTGPVTFSAAIVTASMLKMHGGDKVSFVGEPMGDHDQFWAEGRSLTLPRSGIPVRYSDYFHDWSQPCRAETCLWATRIFGPKERISLQPDVRVPTRFADYSIGTDAVLERALDLARAENQAE